MCKFNSRCEDIPQKDWKFTFTLEDVDYTTTGTRTKEITIDPNDMLIPGPELGETDV